MSTKNVELELRMRRNGHYETVHISSVLVHHTDCVHSQSMQQFGLSDGFKVGSTHHGIYTFLHKARDTHLLGKLHHKATQPFVIATWHSWKAWPKPATTIYWHYWQVKKPGKTGIHHCEDSRIPSHESCMKLLFIVGPTQWVQTDQPREVDVILDDHDVTRTEAISQWACSICHNKCLHSHQLEDSNGKGSLMERQLCISILTYAYLDSMLPSATIGSHLNILYIGKLWACKKLGETSLLPLFFFAFLSELVYL